MRNEATVWELHFVEDRHYCVDALFIGQTYLRFVLLLDGCLHREALLCCLRYSEISAQSGSIALKREPAKLTHNCLDGGQNKGLFSLPHCDQAIDFLQRQSIRPTHRDPAWTPLRIAGHARTETRMARRLAVPNRVISRGWSS
jgi:hypothetical protein